MNVLKSLAFEAAFIGLAAAGWVWDIAAARGAMHTLVWALLLPCALVNAFSVQAQARRAALPGNSRVEVLCNRLAWLVALGVLLWHGAWVTAAAVAVCVVCVFITSDSLRRLRSAQASNVGGVDA